MPAKGGGYSNAGINPARLPPPRHAAPPAPQGAPLRGGLAPAPRPRPVPASSPFRSPFHEQIHAVRQRVAAQEHAPASNPFHGALGRAYRAAEAPARPTFQVATPEARLGRLMATGRESPGLPSTYGGRVGAVPVVRHSHGGGLLDTVASILAPALGSSVASGALKPLVEAGTRKGLAVGDALATDPVGTGRATLTSVPQTLNALLTGTARLGIEGTIEGKPGAALEQFGKAISSDIQRRYGGLSKPGGVEADAARMKREGVLPEALDASLVVGGPGAVAGRALSKAVEATGYGAEDAARLARFREGTRQALQSQYPASVLEPKPSRAATVRGTINEATKARPNLRVAPGNEKPSPSPGAAVKEQDRSPNLFRAVGQTAVDNARRARTERGLRAAAGVRAALEHDPHLAGFLPEPRPHIQPLALDLKRAEVAPLMQKGGASSRFPGAAFVGAGKEQRVGTSRLKGQAVEMRRAEDQVLTSHFNEILKDATPEQRSILVHAKEGTLPLHDPEKAVAALREIHDQAVAGSRDAQGRSLIPWADRRAGSDVAAVTGRVLAHIDKHGAESVFTPQFEDLARAVPDERLTAARDPSLSQDALQSRRYRPQVQHLERWAQRHPDAPLAEHTAAAVEQIKQLEKEGGDLRAGRAGEDLPAEHRHELAHEKYATAKNLADELARAHELPTDRAYVEHTKRFVEGHLVHTVGTAAPAVARRMEGQLAAKGYRSTDAHLILNGMLKNIRNDYKVKYLQPWHDRFNVAPRGLTAHQAREWLVASGRDPKQWAVLHLGKLRASLAEDARMEHAPHFNSDAEVAAARTSNQLEQALGENIPRSDALKGAGVYPIAAVNELKGVFSNSGLPGRVAGKLKSATSALMLGTSLPWLTTMSGVTYPLQSLYGGAGFASLREAVSMYRPLSVADKRAFDRWFGVDTPFELGTHGISSERIGATAPKGFEEMARVLSLAKDYPLTKLLARQRPDHIILRMERVPRRYARINVAYKGIKTQALRQMLEHTKGAMAAQSKFQLAVARMQHFGRRPTQEWIDAALANQHFMEEHAKRLDAVLGEWKNTTQFERNVLGRMVLFYPWLRYSVKLAAKTLPTTHPLAYALALKYGTIQHEYLKELLGTDPTVGDVYLGPEQPNVKPADRKFNVVGIRQANPLVNTVADLLGAESPIQLLDTLPPYVSDLIEYAVGKNLLTDKPLKGADKGETEYKPGHRPSLLNFSINRALSTFAPGRTAIKATGGGKPLSDESLPWAPKPVQYSNRTEAKIRREGAATDPLQALLGEVLPLIPHPDTRIGPKIRAEERAGHEAKVKQRKEHHHAAARTQAASEADAALAAREGLGAPVSSPSGEGAAALAAREKLAR